MAFGFNEVKANLLFKIESRLRKKCVGDRRRFSEKIRIE
jgi:hypothetical protein